MMHVGDTMSTLRDVKYIREYHEYIPGDFRSWESPQTLPALFIGPFVDLIQT